MDYEKLKKVRASKDVTLKPCSFLKEGVQLRTYQTVGVYHLHTVPRMVLGDSMGLGKTLMAIAAMGYSLDKDPMTPIMILAPKSALYQWAGEIDKFTTGIRSFVVSGSKAQRAKTYRRYQDRMEPGVLIMTYDSVVNDWSAGSEIKIEGKKRTLTRGLLDSFTLDLQGLIVVADEASALKNPSSQRWQRVKLLAERASKVWALTATLLKNNLMEGFGIYKLLLPDLLGTKTNFMDNYCHTRRIRVGSREVPIVTGYKNLDGFRDRIDPYFLGRQKHEVSSELPTLITKEHTFTLSQVEDDKYQEALQGILELGTGEVKDYSETAALTSLLYAQKIVDSLTLIGYSDEPEYSKERELLELLTGEYEDAKVIVYTRFESHVDRLTQLCEQAKITVTRITGKVSSKDREKAKEDFQAGDTRVIFITDAATEAVNLQQAEAMIFYNSPWSYGGLLQALGRMIRIGSPHRGVVATHLVAQRPGGKKTIDNHVLKLLASKKGLIEQVLGVSTQGALEFKKVSDSKELLLEILRDLQTVSR